MVDMPSDSHRKEELSPVPMFFGTCADRKFILVHTDNYFWLMLSTILFFFFNVNPTGVLNQVDIRSVLFHSFGYLEL